jgi:hypothetical protein
MSDNQDPDDLDEEELAQIIKAVEREHERERQPVKKVIILNGTVIQNGPVIRKGRSKGSVRSN